MPPDFATIWQRMLGHAESCMQTNAPIRTLQRDVINYITYVNPNRIGRRSEDGRNQDEHEPLRKSQAEKYWFYLLNGGPHPNVLRFVPAFMFDALRDLLNHDGNGNLRLKPNSPITRPVPPRLPPILIKQSLQSPKVATKPLPAGEGEIHRGIKQAIYDRPNEILDGLPGKPFRPYANEYQFSTGDRVDVVLSDADGKIVLIEVKPFIAIDDKAPFAQVAKYRTLWNILNNLHVGDIRVLVVAPEIPRKLAEQMLAQHRIEFHAVGTSWL